MTPDAPAVSVLLPAYNGEPYLSDAVESILAQTHRDFEFLLVDDGSTDRTPELLAGFTDPRIRKFRNERNLGFASSLNRGLGEARGRLQLARMDADDLSDPRRLAAQVRFLDANPTVGVVATDHALMGSRGEILQSSILGRDIPAAEVEWRLLWENLIAHPSVMMRTSLLRAEGGYSEEFRHYAEDLDLWFRLASRTEIAVLGQVLVRLRKHDRNVTVIDEAPHIDEVAETAREHLGRLLGTPPSPAAVRLLRRLPVQLPATANDLEAARDLLHDAYDYIVARHGSRPTDMTRIRSDQARRLLRLVRLRVPRPRGQALRLLGNAFSIAPAATLSTQGLKALVDGLLGPHGVEPPVAPSR